MTDAWLAMAMGLLIFLATLISIEVGISVALIEIVLGVIAGNFLRRAPSVTCEPLFPMHRELPQRCACTGLLRSSWATVRIPRA